MFKLAIGLLASVAAGPALAAENWWYAETDHFRVYSAGGEVAAQDMAVKLERVDEAMRLFTGVAFDDAPLPENAKPTVFQFGETEDIGDLIGVDGVAGFFMPRAGDSVAFVPLEAGRARRRSGSPGARQGYEYFDFDIPPEAVLFHEYAHYFMFQHAPAAYPAWYVEGLAELFGSLKLQEDGFALGEAPAHRQGEIAMIDVNIDRIFRPDEREERSIRYPYYGHGWLLTSYLSFQPERQGQLAEFLRAINRGEETRVAAQAAFGDLDTLEKELNAYRRERVRGMAAKFPKVEEPEVALRALTPDQAARMQSYIRSTVGVDQQQAAGVYRDTQKLLEQYPDSTAVKRTAMEAAFDTKDYKAADMLARGLLDTDEAVDANLYLARIALEYAKTEPVWVQKARTHYIAANQIDSQEPNALSGYYRTFRLADEEPPEDALIALEQSYELAPFDQGIRLMLAHLLLLENRDKAALGLLGPVVNQPHGGKLSKKLRDLVSKLEEGNRAPLIEELAPSLEEKED